ncbi:hypothetical protein GCK72_003501 [Caenorhabditis remanei]|uniref:CRE-ZTF-6 protein n=1 Tax=Caenorhabditis remanei TaxID=31234 RepID=E3M8Q9_CAERE|nr:hypothetical protein GCK72_003501 [Caenorhabditis remanei]EFO95760.1 CRE-ZTF-6 protein [Caenorhabditis remanei]KAF1771674.1 hypothetical protein GCK72_003501 [Caenorhabditis remanei]
MGPAETTPERVSEDLMQAVTCLKRVMTGMKNCSDVHDEESPLDSTTVICTLEKITGALERCMENNKTLNDVLSGKMKCTTCGSTSVGFLSDCHDSATSTTTTASHRSSEEPPRHRKTSGDDDEDLDEVCSSIGSRSIRSVSSSVNQDDVDDAQNQTILAVEPRTEGSKTPEEEEEEHDLVMKTILSSTTSTSTSASSPYRKSSKQEENSKEEQEETPSSIDSNLLDQFLQNSLLGVTPDVLKGIMETTPEPPTTTTNSEENEEEKDQNALLSSFFQILFANQQNGDSPMLEDVSENNTDSSSQPSPPADPNNFDSLAMIETLLAESLNQSDQSAESKAAAAAAAARKRKSTPMKVPKSENGAGYVCPMEGCNKIFKEKGSVHRHFVTHIGMRFNCDKCKASYTQKHALMLHQKIHANPDAYQCRGCGTNYTTQNGLRLHRQRNPQCTEHNSSASMSDFNSSLSEVLAMTKASTTPNKQMVVAP